RLIGGWQLGSIISIQDGTPFTALTGFNSSNDLARSTSDRPDLKPGARNNPILGGPNRYYDPNSFVVAPAGRYGNLGRNTLVGPGLVNFDFDLIKTIPMNERFRMDLRAEFYNFFNHPNFGQPDNTVF